jgi:hypothetical protein
VLRYRVQIQAQFSGSCRVCEQYLRQGEYAAVLPPGGIASSVCERGGGAGGGGGGGAGFNGCVTENGKVY